MPRTYVSRHKYSFFSVDKSRGLRQFGRGFFFFFPHRPLLLDLCLFGQCHARFIWGLDVFGNSQQLKARSQCCRRLSCRRCPGIRTAAASGGSPPGSRSPTEGNPPHARRLTDETSFAQGNADGGNPEGRKAWLWVAVTPLVTFFQVLLNRSQEAAQALLGKAFGGILTSDRHGGYNWVDLSRRQLCWAHLKREFIKISERPEVCSQLGEALVKQQEKLFELWHRVRDGTLARSEFREAAHQIREQVKTLLQEGADYEIGSQEKTPLAKTVRTCRQLLKVEPAMWLFVTTEGVEPTNNAAERAIRPAVLWRRTSFGSQSQTGSTFVARMLTVVTTLR